MTTEGVRTKSLIIKTVDNQTIQALQRANGIRVLDERTGKEIPAELLATRKRAGVQVQYLMSFCEQIGNFRSITRRRGVNRKIVH